MLNAQQGYVSASRIIRTVDLPAKSDAVDHEVVGAAVVELQREAVHLIRRPVIHGILSMVSVTCVWPTTWSAFPAADVLLWR